MILVGLYGLIASVTGFIFYSKFEDRGRLPAATVLGLAWPVIFVYILFALCVERIANDYQE